MSPNFVCEKEKNKKKKKTVATEVEEYSALSLIAIILIYQYIHIRFRTKNINRNIESHSIMINWSILQEDMTVLNICAPNNRPSKHRKQNLLKLQGGKDKFTITVGDFNLTFYKIGGANRRSSPL